MPSERFCPVCNESFSDDIEECPTHQTKLIVMDSIEEVALKRIGEVIDGKFELTGVLGSGGMGVVYRAKQINLGGRDVALKVLNPTIANDAVAAKRFIREANIVSTLSHPNTVTIFDFSRTDDGILYLCMELVEGESLDEIILREAPLDPERALRIAENITDSLGEAHGKNVIHRDLKPANVIVQQRFGQPDFARVLDFGIAKQVEPDDDEEQLTATGAVCGTAAYMSPEQAMGNELDGRSDIYSLGCILYQMLTGAPPFKEKKQVQVMVAHVTKEVPRLNVVAPERDFPAELVELVAQMTTKKVDERPTAAALKRAFQKAELVAAIAQEIGNADTENNAPKSEAVEDSSEVDAPASDTAGAAMATEVDLQSVETSTKSADETVDLGDMGDDTTPPTESAETIAAEMTDESPEVLEDGLGRPWTQHAKPTALRPWRPMLAIGATLALALAFTFYLTQKPISPAANSLNSKNAPLNSRAGGTANVTDQSRIGAQCPADITCPPHYAQLAGFMEQICTGRFNAEEMAKLKATHKAGLIDQSDLLYMFNIVGAFYGYRFKKLTSLNAFFYDSRKAQWLPSGCIKHMEAYPDFKSVPMAMKRYRDPIKAFWKTQKNSAASLPGGGMNEFGSTGGVDTPKACPAHITCPKNYERSARFLGKICNGSFTLSDFKALQKSHKEGGIAQDDLLYLFNIVGAFHGYEFGKAWSKNFFYHKDASSWLPKGCPAQIKRYKARNDVPPNMQLWQVKIRDFWKANRNAQKLEYERLLNKNKPPKVPKASPEQPAAPAKSAVVHKVFTITAAPAALVDSGGVTLGKTPFRRTFTFKEGGIRVLTFRPAKDTERYGSKNFVLTQITPSSVFVTLPPKTTPQPPGKKGAPTTRDKPAESPQKALSNPGSEGERIQRKATSIERELEL